MKLARLEKWYFIALAVIFGGIVVHAPLSVGLGTLFPHYSLLIKSWKEIIMLLLLPVAAVIVSKRHMWRELLNDWIIRLIAAYIALYAIITVLLYQGLTAAAAGLEIDLRYVLFFSLVYICIKVSPQYRRPLLIIGVIGAFVVVCFATLQLFLPADILSHIGYNANTIEPYLTVDKNTSYIRVNSTLRGPNPLGAYAAMVLGLITAALVRGKLEFGRRRVLVATIILTVCSVVALWISYSRSALIAGVVAVALVLLVTVGRKVSRRVWIAVVIVLCLMAGGLALDKGNAFVASVFFHKNVHGGSATTSDEGHISSLENGVHQLVRQPLGVGVGSTGSASLYTKTPTIIENQYLFVAHETGWLGLILYVWLFVLVEVRLWRGRKDWLCLGMFAAGIGMAIIGLLLPVWEDDTVSIIWWGLVAIALAGGVYARKQTH